MCFQQSAICNHTLIFVQLQSFVLVLRPLAAGRKQDCGPQSFKRILRGTYPERFFA